MSSTREAVRAFREFMTREMGPNWLHEFIRAGDPDKDWRTITFDVYGKDGKVIQRFCLACRGGYLGESLPDGEFWETFPDG